VEIDYLEEIKAELDELEQQKKILSNNKPINGIYTRSRIHESGV
jgi:hypothetical protein